MLCAFAQSDEINWGAAKKFRGVYVGCPKGALGWYLTEVGLLKQIEIKLKMLFKVLASGQSLFALYFNCGSHEVPMHLLKLYGHALDTVLLLTGPVEENRHIPLVMNLKHEQCGGEHGFGL